MQPEEVRLLILGRDGGDGNQLCLGECCPQGGEVRPGGVAEVLIAIRRAPKRHHHVRILLHHRGNGSLKICALGDIAKRWLLDVAQTLSRQIGHR